MSYDFEGASDRKAPKVSTAKPQANDLEAIVMLLELAAIYLTPEPGTQFTYAQLLAQARELGGNEIGIDEKDVQIVLGKAGFLKKSGDKLQLK